MEIHHHTPLTSPLCWCNTGEQETYLHLLFKCSKNNLAADALLRVVQSYDPACTEEKSLRLELNPDETFLLPTASILSTGLNFIWENRKSRKSTSLFSIRSELETSVSLKRKSSYQKYQRDWRYHEKYDRKFL